MTSAVAPKSKYARDLRIWTILGQLREEVVRDIAHRLRDGQKYDAISAAIGIGKDTGRRKCAEIGAAMGLPVEESRHVVFARQVVELVEQDLTDLEIAERLRRSVHSVTAARQRALGPKYKIVRLTPDEHETIDQMILKGFNQYEIAREVGCHQTLVAIRAKKLDQSKMRSIRPPCKCGKPAGHGSRCHLLVDPAFIRERLLAGATAADIARELGRCAQPFKPKYVQPVIDQLTAEGHRCGCGKPFGHRFVCPVTMAGQRRTFTGEETARATEMIRDGAAVRAVREALGLSVSAATMLADQVRAALAAEGVRCPCGKPIDHTLSCTARNGDAKGRTAFRFASAAAASMTAEIRRRISKLARAGHGCKLICEKTGESEWRVDVLIAELRGAGLTPAQCATCERPFNHKGPCPLPKSCACGRRRNHRGPCREAGPKRTVANGGKPPKIERSLYREAMIRYRDGESIRRISDRTSISWGVVQRLVAYWRRKSAYRPQPCVCGRPARHRGGCVKNTPGAVGKLEKARIVAGIQSGAMPHHLAARLNLHVQTVLKHSASTRSAMFAAGVTCACGRPIAHPYWCSAKWDAYEQPRGRRPFPEPQEKQAVEALLRGDVVADIASAIGVGTDSIWRLRQTLSADQRRQRARMMRDRLAMKGDSESARLMKRVRAAVPRNLIIEFIGENGRPQTDTSLRDDVVMEIYLAVIEGRIEAEQIGAAVKSFVAKGRAQWQPKYGHRSLDAKLSQDGTRTLSDMIGDPTAAQSIDEIEIGQPPP